MWKAAVPAIVVAFVAAAGVNIFKTVRPFQPQLPIDSSTNCQLLDRPWGAEDMAVVSSKAAGTGADSNGSGSWVITTSLDMGPLAERGVDSCAERDSTGGLWAFRPTDLTTPPRPLQLKNFPTEKAYPCFLTHGLFLSEKTDRLYVVMHHGDSSSVEIFAITYHQQPSSDDDGDDNNNEPRRNNDREPPFTLTWMTSVTSPLFPNLALNAVVEGYDRNELYVTQFVPSPFPLHGRKHPSTWLETAQQAMLLPAFLLGLRQTKVFRCTFDAKDSTATVCHEATAGRAFFRMANGITISDDRQTIFVNDVMERSIAVLERDPDTGVLIPKDQIPLDQAVDNIKWQATSSGGAEIWMGTVTDVALVFKNEAKELEQRALISGGLAVVSSLNGKEWSPQRIVYNHNGSRLSQPSIGMIVDGKIVLGSAYSKGILVCDYEQEE